MWGSFQKRKKTKVVEGRGDQRPETEQLQRTTTCCGLRKRETVTRRNSKQEYERVREKEKKKKKKELSTKKIISSVYSRMD